MSIELKIKSKHLSTEPAIIRFEERKLINQMRYRRSRQNFDGMVHLDAKFHNLRSHRRWDVRNESRATFLARAFLDGKPYNTVERKVHSFAVLRSHIVPRIIDMVMKYGPTPIYKIYNRQTNKMEWPKDDYEIYKALVLAWLGIPL